MRPHDGSHVFVDDIDREVEAIYAHHYLRPRFGDPEIQRGRGGFAHVAPR